MLKVLSLLTMVREAYHPSGLTLIGVVMGAPYTPAQPAMFEAMIARLNRGPMDGSCEGRILQSCPGRHSRRLLRLPKKYSPLRDL